MLSKYPSTADQEAPEKAHFVLFDHESQRALFVRWGDSSVGTREGSDMYTVVATIYAPDYRLALLVPDLTLTLGRLDQ